MSAVTRPVNSIHPTAQDVRAVSQTVASREREQSLSEEIANSISHGVGLVAAVIAVPFLVSWQQGEFGSFFRRSKKSSPAANVQA